MFVLVVVVVVSCSGTCSCSCSCLSIYLPICKLENEAILRDFFSFWTWQHQKRSNSARLPQFLNLTTSKTKQFCETSSFFEVDNIKNEAILRDSLQKWKVECRADGLVPMCFEFFPLHLSKVLRLPRKSDTRSYEVLHLSRKIIFPKLKISCSIMQPISGNQRPDLLTALMNMSLVLRLPRKIHLCRSSSNVPRLPSFFEMRQNPHVLLTFDKVHNPCACHAKRHLNVQKCCVPRSFFTLLTWKCASRHNGVQLSLIWPAGFAPAALIRFSEPTFRPSGATYHWKSTMFRDFPTFSRTCMDLLSSETFSFWSSFFFSSLRWLFPSLFICPHCRKFDF